MAEVSVFYDFIVLGFCGTSLKIFQMVAVPVPLRVNVDLDIAGALPIVVEVGRLSTGLHIIVVGFNMIGTTDVFTIVEVGRPSTGLRIVVVGFNMIGTLSAFTVVEVGRLSTGFRIIIVLFIMIGL